MTAAGIIWIVFGIVILLNMPIVLAVLGAADPRAAALGGPCVGIFLGVIGGVFIHVGVTSVRGTAKDTLGNAIGSIIIGLLNAAGGTVQLNAGQIVQAVVSYAAGVGLIGAGVLALVGRGQYREWKREMKAQAKLADDQYRPRRDADKPPRDYDD